MAEGLNIEHHGHGHESEHEHGHAEQQQAPAQPVDTASLPDVKLTPKAIEMVRKMHAKEGLERRVMGCESAWSAADAPGFSIR